VGTCFTSKARASSLWSSVSTRHEALSGWRSKAISRFGRKPRACPGGLRRVPRGYDQPPSAIGISPRAARAFLAEALVLGADVRAAEPVSTTPIDEHPTGRVPGLRFPWPMWIFSAVAVICLPFRVGPRIEPPFPARLIGIRRTCKICQ
jgi:hypothetical protein